MSQAVPSGGLSVAAEVSGGEWAGIITSIVGGLVAIGAGVKWMFSTRAAQQKMVDDAVRRQFKHLEDDLAEANRRISLLTRGVHNLAAEVARYIPDSPVLRQTQRILDMAFPLPTGTPDPHADLMDELHERTRGRQ